MKVNIKKLLSAIVTFAMSVSMIPQMVSAAEITWEARTNAVDLRVGITADTHVTSTDNAFEFERPIKAFSQIDSAMDAVLLTGDIIYGDETAQQPHFEACYDAIKDKYDDYFSVDSTPMLYAMGNHEFPISGKNEKAALAYAAFQNKIGDVNQTNVINGYTFITAAPQHYFGVLTTETEQYIMNAANAAIAEDANKPVFLSIHHPTNDQYGTNQSYYSDEFYAWLHTTPQIIMFTAHTHNTAQSPSIIKQVEGGYTVVCVPFAGNSIYNVRSGGVSAIFDDAKKADSRYQWNCARESILLEAEGNVVKLYVMDLLYGRYVSDAYVIDIPALIAGTGYSYTDERFEKSTAPEFPANATLTVTENEDVQGEIKIEFSNNAVKETESQPGYQDDFVFAYRVKIEDTEGEYILKSADVAGEFYLPEEKHSASLATTMDGLEAGKTYTVSVAPMSAFLAVGKAITKEITISGEKATYTKLAEWTPRENSIVKEEIDGKIYRFIKNNVDSEKFQLDMTNETNDDWVQHIEPLSTATYSQLYYTQPFTAANPIYGHYPVINAGDLALAMNDGFTIDAWVNISIPGQNKVFGVYDYDADTNTYTPKFQIGFDPSTTNGGLKIERQTTNGENVTMVSKFAERINFGEWHHIAATVNAKGEVPEFTFYIDGKKMSLTTLAAYNTASETDTAVAFDADDIVVFAGPGGWSKATPTKISDAAIYQDQLPEGAVIENYYKNAGDFDHVFDVKVENIEGSVVSYQGLKSLKKDKIKKITVDVTADAKNVSKNNFEIYNVTDGEPVDFNYSLDGTTVTIAGIDVEDNKSYKLIIRDIKNTDGDLIRRTNQVLEFATVLKVKNCEKLAEWKASGGSVITKQIDGKTYRILENSVDAEKYPIDMCNDGPSWQHTIVPVSDNIYSQKSYLKYFGTDYYGHFPVINGGELAASLNNDFTLETWVNVKDATAKHTLFGIYDTSAAVGNEKLRIEITHAKTHATARIKRKITDGANETLETFGNSNLFKYNQWHHLVMTVSNSSGKPVIDLYVDGVKYYNFNASNAGVEFDTDDQIVFAGPGSWGNATGVYFSDIAFYQGIYDEETVVENYSKDLPQYETMFDTQLCNLSGNAYTINEINTLNAEKVSAFKVDLTADAKPATKDNFEIYCIDTAKNIDFNLSNEGSVYTLSGFKLADDMEYQFIVKDVKKTDDTLFRTTKQVLNVTTVIPAIKNKIAEWIIGDYSNGNRIANSVNADNALIDINQPYGATILPVSEFGYSNKKYLKPCGGIYGRYDVDNAGQLAASMNDGFTFETWFMPGDGDWTTCPSILTITDENENIKFTVQVPPNTQDRPEGIKLIRAGENSENFTAKGCIINTDDQIYFDKWYHMVVSVGSNITGTLGDMELFINGNRITLTEEGSSNGTPITFEATDKIFLHGPNAWVTNSVLISDTAIYGGNFDLDSALARYDATVSNYVEPQEVILTKATVAADGTISATVKNNEDLSKPVVLVVAVYNGTQLDSADLVDLGTIESGETATPEKIDVKGGEELTVKFMLWDGISTMIPYQPAFTR